MIDVSRETTLSVETVTEAVRTVSVSTLTEGETLESAIVQDQTTVMSPNKALSIPFKTPVSKDVMMKMETPLLEYVQKLSTGNHSVCCYKIGMLKMSCYP